MGEPAHRSTAFRLPRLLLAILATQAVWGAWFIWRTSFTAGRQRTFCLFDDAMISMTYARNLVAGYGLNWARFGAPVEGFSHPLWTFSMVLVHLLPLDQRFTSLAMQLLSWALLLATTIATYHLACRHFVPAGSRRWLIAVLPTAFFYPLHHWALQGMETALQALLTLLAVHWTLDLLALPEDRRRPILALGAVLAASYLLRMDMLLTAAVCLGALALGRTYRRSDRRSWILGLGLFAGAIGGYEIFRLSYFGDPLPNTYYLKMTGTAFEVRLLRGLESFSGFALPLLWLWIALAIMAIATGVFRLRAFQLVSAVVLVHWAYSIWIGGDVWEKAGLGANRFTAFVMPLVFVAASGLFQRTWEALGRARSGRTSSAWAEALVALLVALGVNHLWPGAPQAYWNRFLVLDLPLHVHEHRQFTRQVLALQRDGLVAPDARVATVWAGIPAYFSTWEMVDVLGYNDRHLAHLPSTVQLEGDDYRDYMPGHVKYDWDYTLTTYRPDLVYQVWGLPPEKLARTMKRHGYAARQSLWLRIDSQKVEPVGWARALATAR